MKKILILIAAVFAMACVNAQTSVDFNVQTHLKQRRYSATISFTQGEAPFSIRLNGRAGDLNDLRYGETYVISVSDANNSEKSDTITIENPHFCWGEMFYFDDEYPSIASPYNFRQVGVKFDAHYTDEYQIKGRWFRVADGQELLCGYSYGLRSDTMTCEISFSVNETPYGTYAIELLDPLREMDTVVFLTIQETVGISDIPKKDYSIFPNPTTNIATISEVVKNIEILSNDGKVIMQRRNTNKINLSMLPSGIYYIVLDNTVKKKVVKK